MVDRTQGMFSGRRVAAALILALAVPAISACESTSGLKDVDIAKMAPPKIKVTPQMVEAADSALIEGRYQDARHSFSRILVADPKNIDAKMGLGEVYLATGDWKRADAVYRDLSDQKSLRGVGLQGQGLALLLAGKHTAAKHMFQQALSQDKTLWRSWNGLGQCQDREKAFAAAEQSYRHALEYSPKPAVVYNNLGYSMLLRGRYQDAERQFLTALQSDPGMKIAQSNLRLALAWQGRYSEALAGSPIRQKVKILNNVGFVAMLRGDYARAEAFFTQAMDGSASFYDVAWRNMEALRALRPHQASSARQTSMLRHEAGSSAGHAK